MESKLNQLLKQWPKGAVATAAWLHQNGAYRQLARQYVASGWMEPLEHGAFVRAGENADWLGGLYALQNSIGAGHPCGGGHRAVDEGARSFLALGRKSRSSVVR